MAHLSLSNVLLLSKVTNLPNLPVREEEMSSE